MSKTPRLVAFIQAVMALDCDETTKGTVIWNVGDGLHGKLSELIRRLTPFGLSFDITIAAAEAWEEANPQGSVSRRLAEREYQSRHPLENWTPRLPEKEWLPLTGRVYRRDGYVCSYCGDTDGPFAIDHIHPLSRGGSNDISNLCVACRACNSSKGDKLLVSEWNGRGNQ